MSDAWLQLDPGEEIEWEARPRLMRAASAILASAVIVLVALGGAAAGEPLALVLLVVAPLPGVYGYFRVTNTRFVVTNRSLYRKRGLLGIEVRTVELDRVQNTQSTQGVFGTVFGYGTVEIEVAGGRDLQFYDIYDPDDVRRLIERLSGSLETLPGTLEQWTAVRDELCEISRLLENQPK